MPRGLHYAVNMSPMPPASAPQHHDTTTMSLVGLAHGTSHFHHLLLPPLFPVFLKTFGLNYTELGMLVTVFFAISGTGQALAGFVVDRIGPLKVLWLALGCFVLASLAAATAQGFTGLMLAAALAGLGNAPFHPVDFTILNQRISHQRLGRAFAVHGISGNVGWALAPVLLLGITEFTGQWRLAYAACALLTLGVMGLLVWQRQHLRTTAHRVVAPSAGSAALVAPAEHTLAFLKQPAVWLCFSFFLWTTAALSAIQSFASPALHHLYGLPLSAAAMVVTAYMVCGVVGMVIGGWALGRVARLEQLISWALLLAALLLALAGSGLLNGWGALVVTALAGFGTGLAGPSRDMLVKQATPPGATGRVYGAVYSGLDIGFALAAPVFGALLDHGMDAGVFWGAAGLMLMGVWSARQAGAHARPRLAAPTAQ